MMNIAIICAMEEELLAVQRQIKMPLVETICKVGNTYYQYSDGESFIVAVVCGIGKVNAAITTQLLLCNFNVDYVVNVGVAGSLSTALSFGDIVVATDLVQHDCDVTAFGLPLGQIARMDTFSFAADQELSSQILEGLTSEPALKKHSISYGRIATGDQFIDDAERAEFLQSHFKAVACEMEGGAIAHVCHVNEVPFVVVRALSDMAGRSDDASHSFEQLKAMAANCAALAVKQILESK